MSQYIVSNLGESWTSHSDYMRILIVTVLLMELGTTVLRLTRNRSFVATVVAVREVEIGRVAIFRSS